MGHKRFGWSRSLQCKEDNYYWQYRIHSYLCIWHKRHCFAGNSRPDKNYIGSIRIFRRMNQSRVDKYFRMTDSNFGRDRHRPLHWNSKAQCKSAWHMPIRSTHIQHHMLYILSYPWWHTVCSYSPNSSGGTACCQVYNNLLHNLCIHLRCRTCNWGKCLSREDTGLPSWATIRFCSQCTWNLHWKYRSSNWPCNYCRWGRWCWRDSKWSCSLYRSCCYRSSHRLNNYQPEMLVCLMAEMCRSSRRGQCCWGSSQMHKKCIVQFALRNQSCSFGSLVVLSYRVRKWLDWKRESTHPHRLNKLLLFLCCFHCLKRWQNSWHIRSELGCKISSFPRRG